MIFTAAFNNQQIHKRPKQKTTVLAKGIHRFKSHLYVSHF